jgi:hypothetical protein
MNFSIESLKSTRAFALRLADGLSDEVLNIIPEGFSNIADYNAWTTPCGVALHSIDKALQFLLFHEGMHCGYIMTLKRALAIEAVHHDVTVAQDAG